MASSECAKYDGSEVILLDEYLSRQQLPIFFFQVWVSSASSLRGREIYWDIGMIGFVLMVPGFMQ